MRATRLIAAAALAAATFATTPAALAHHGEQVCHDDDDVWLGQFAGVDNPTTGPQQGALACVYLGSTYIVGVSREVSTGHSCISIYYGISSAFLGCYL